MTPELSSLIAYTQRIEEELFRHPIVKKIKVTTFFYYYLMAKFENDILFEKDGLSYDKLANIPIEIDDAINGYYELVYKEN